jgi:hypothetical protein
LSPARRTVRATPSCFVDLDRQFPAERGPALVEGESTRRDQSWRERLRFAPALIERIGFVMSREVLLGIKARAEHAACQGGEGRAP